jgi:hypothetical protein
MGMVVHMSGAALRGLRTDLGARLLVAALFALSLAAPRAALFVHHHDGGEHTHQHLDAELAALIGIEPHHHDADTAPRGSGYAADRGASGAHVHHQQRYQAAVATVVAYVAVSLPLAPFVAAPDRPAPARPTRTADARGPPALSIG